MQINQINAAQHIAMTGRENVDSEVNLTGAS
jgi:hypothetical protein